MACPGRSTPTATGFIVQKNRPPTLAEQLSGKQRFTQVGRALVRYNARFMVPAREPEPVWRPGGPLALPRRSDGRSWAGRSVVLQERLDGSLWVSHDGLCLMLTAAPADPVTLRARDLSRLSEGRDDLDLGLLPAAHGSPSPNRPAPSKPGPDHPWRKGYAARGR